VAERQKTLNGAAFLSPRDEIDKLIIPMLGEESTNVQIPQSRLISIIIPRLEEILGNIKRVFEKYPYFGVATKQIVLSGGGSMLQGIQEKTATILNSTVRIGKPETIRGLSSQFEVYTFSTCIGLLKYVMIKEKSLLNEKFKSQSTPKKGFIGKVTQWLIQNF
jgi:cell division protein FtsA